MVVTSRRVADELRSRILMGALPAGTPLRQEAIAAEFGVSRMPVRDALAMLQQEGLLASRPDRGFVVSSLTPADCIEIFRLRILLEAQALSRAIPRHTARTMRALARIQEDLEIEDDIRGWIEGDRAFHRTLYAPCESPRLVGMIGSLRNEVERFCLSGMSPDVRRDEWREQHRGLIAAVGDKDCDAALRILTDHLQETERVALEFLKSSRG